MSRVINWKKSKYFMHIKGTEWKKVNHVLHYWEDSFAQEEIDRFFIFYIKIKCVSVDPCSF
jgi:hypothetical protein